MYGTHIFLVFGIWLLWIFFRRTHWDIFEAFVCTWLMHGLVSLGILLEMLLVVWFLL
jgi:hypothetical protein